MTKANSRSNARSSRIRTLYVSGERSAATSPIAMRRRIGERIEERCIFMRSTLWQGLQITHLWRGSGAPTGSLSATGHNQIASVQIEQRRGLYQRPLRLVSRLVPTVASFPGAMSRPLAFLFGRTIGYQHGGELLCS